MLFTAGKLSIKQELSVKEKMPPHKKTIIFSLLVITTLVLAFSALFLGSQMSEAQEKVRYLQSQATYYQSMTDTLQTQASSLETQINNLQNPTDNVTFTAITVGPWVYEEYTPTQKKFNVTFQNVGTRNIGGVTLEFKVEGNTTNIGPFEIYVNPHQLGIIHVRESKSLIVTLVAGFAGYPDSPQVLSQCDFTFTLMLDKVVFDRQTVMIGL
jgi:cell division protein FtsL